jgi:hypothetical protein
MSLLTRMAISNGNKERKNNANTLLVTMDRHKVAKWNQGLQIEVNREARCCPLSINYLEEVNMNWFLSLIIEMGLYLLAFDVVVSVMVYIGIRFIKPRRPEWWERNIADIFPPDWEPGLF